MYSNDPSFELDPTLGKSINFDAFEPFIELCKMKLKDLYMPLLQVFMV